MNFPIGMTADWKGQHYELVGFKPHINRKGENRLLLVWRSRCRACGEPFDCATPQGEMRGPTRNCPKHHFRRISETQGTAPSALS
jgi:hypothetical protein